MSEAVPPISLMFETLVSLDPSATFIPRLATWEFSDDNAQVTFYINKSANWHDGNRPPSISRRTRVRSSSTRPASIPSDSGSTTAVTAMARR